ncbi:MAG: hypothetical protein JWQ33_1096 [Ramlibacter sp.]|nr:hypothetical protein [Ramlibacter sp.]
MPPPAEQSRCMFTGRTRGAADAAAIHNANHASTIRTKVGVRRSGDTQQLSLATAASKRCEMSFAGVQNAEMHCPKCDTLLYRAHRPAWMRHFNWARIYYCARCKKKFFRLKWGVE